MNEHLILYAEDDMDDVDLVKTVFSNHQHIKLLHCWNGLEAIKTLEDLKKDHSLPCLIILDINMPIMDGKQALAKIKEDELLQEIPVVVFTTSNSELDKKFATKMGADFITKPLSHHEVYNLAEEFTKKCKGILNPE